MSAASFAEAGEFDTARELLTKRKKVLLVVTGRPEDEKAFQYAVNMADRTSADIEALVINEGGKVKQMLRTFTNQASKNGVGFVTVKKKKGCIKEAIVKHTRRRRDFLCVVIESTDSLEIDCARENQKLEGVWGELGCPLAVVS
jgi:K+-sensing histidine kinase KdpD